MVDLEVVGKEGNDFIVKASDREPFVKIENTFADTYYYTVMTRSVLGTTPLFFCEKF